MKYEFLKNKNVKKAELLHTLLQYKILHTEKCAKHVRQVRDKSTSLENAIKKYSPQNAKKKNKDEVYFIM